MIDFIVLLLLTVFAINQKYRLAVKNGSLAGFVLNPLLYLIFFSFFYLIVGNFFVLNEDVYDFFNLSKFKYSIEDSVIKINVFYFILLVFYFFSKDNLIEKNPNFKISNDYIRFLKYFGVFLIAYLAIVAAIAYVFVFPLKNDREMALEAYSVVIFSPLKYGFVVNLNLAFIFIISMLSVKDRFLLFLTWISAFLILFIDFTHGGRSMSISVFLVFYIAYVINRKSLFLGYVFFGAFLLILSGAVQRVDSGFAIESIYIALGEFVLTRSTTDIVLTNLTSGDYFQPLQCITFSILPSFVDEIFNVQKCFLTDIIKDNSGASFGLASNPVTEAIYFFGDFYFISAFLIGFYLYIINKHAFRFGFVGVFIILFTIFGMQNTIRTSFFDSGVSVFYLMATHLLIFSILFYNKKILRAK
jgi:hypothetical protein